MIRILVSSDWHADASTAGHERFADVEVAVDETVEAAVQQRCTHYLFLGDLCDPDETRSHRAVALALRTALRLADHGIASHWIVGNHDVVEDGHRSHTLLALKALEGEVPLKCSVHDGPTIARLDDRPDGRVALVALPYTPRSHAYDPEDFIRRSDTFGIRCQHVVVAGHLNLAGITPGSETDDMPRGREVFFPIQACREVFGDRAVLLNGHYHRGQVYEGVHVPGSLERLTFGEAGHTPGWLILEVDDG